MFRFKGEKVVKKKKSRKGKQQIHQEEIEPDESTEAENDKDSIWIICKEIEFLKGPIIILNNFNIPLNHVAGTEKVSFKAVPHPDFDFDTTSDTPPTIPLSSTKPWVGSQVFLAHPHLGSKKYTIKSCFDKMVSCDKFGIIRCEMEAAGLEETWEIVKYEDGWCFKSFHGTYLTISPHGQLRGDAQELDINCRFRVKIQSENKRRMQVDLKPIEKSVDSELGALKKFHSFGNKHVGLLARNVDELKEAKKRGNLNEVMLERRSLLKKDKFC